VQAIASRDLFSSRTPNIWKKRPRLAGNFHPKYLATGYDLPTKDITDSPSGMEIVAQKKKNENIIRRQKNLRRNRPIYLQITRVKFKRLFKALYSLLSISFQKNIYIHEVEWCYYIIIFLQILSLGWKCIVLELRALWYFLRQKEKAMHSKMVARVNNTGKQHW